MYQDVLDAFGNVSPFTNTRHAELKHFEAASKLFTKSGLDAPASEWRQQPEGGDEMRPQFVVKAALVACLVLVSFTMAAPAAFGQGRPGGGGGGWHTEAAVNCRFSEPRDPGLTSFSKPIPPAV